MAPPAGTVTYTAKHPFNGDTSASQLSFAKGELIYGKANQTSGNGWLWGSCRGKQGWFPASYVIQATLPPQVPQPQVNAQQRMQAAVFTSSTSASATGRPVASNDLLGMSFTSSLTPNAQPQQQASWQNQQQQQSGYSYGLSTASTAMQNQPPQSQPAFGVQAPGTSLALRSALGDDPFADLDAKPAPLLSQPASVSNPVLSSSATNGFASIVSPLPPASGSALGTVFTSPSYANNAPTMHQAQPHQNRMSMFNAPSATASIGSVTSKDSVRSSNISSVFESFTQAHTQPHPQIPMQGSTLSTIPSPSRLTKVTDDPLLSPARPISAASSDKGRIPSPTMDYKPTLAKLPDSANSASTLQASLSNLSSVRPTSPPVPLSVTTNADAGLSGSVYANARRASTQGQTPEKRAASPLPTMVSNQSQSNSNAAPVPSLSWGKHSNGIPAQNSVKEVTSGMGKSPVNEDAPRKDLSHLMPPSYNPTTSSAFNPYEYLAGPNAKLPKRTFDPIYKTLPYWHLLNLNVYIRGLPTDVKDPSKAEPSAHYDVLIKAMSFLGHVMDQSFKSSNYDPLLDALKDNHIALEACLQLINILPHSVGVKNVDAAFLNLLNLFVPLLGNMRSHQQLVIPGGWSTLVQGTGDIKTSSHLMLYVLKNQGDSTWSFTVCNLGPEGLEYHPSSIDEDSGREMKQLALTIWNIPSDRILDSSFWTLLFRMQIYPHRRNGPQLLYEHLLPALNSRPLLSNMRNETIEFLPLPSRDQTNMSRYYDLALLALTMSPVPPPDKEDKTQLAQYRSFSSKFASLLVKNAAVALTYRDIADMRPCSMDYEDARILKLTGRNLANYASTMELGNAAPELLSETLSDTWRLLDRLLKKITTASSTPMDQHNHPSIPRDDDFSKGNVQSMLTNEGAALHPLFGRLRRDDFDKIQRALMGDPMPESILIPVVLSDKDMPHIATDYDTARSSLQRICHACSLLLQQRKQIKNAASFAASAAQYALTTTLPMPNLDPKYCFWRSKPMRRETQTMLLFLIRRVCRIYSAATACVQKSRGLIAIQTIALASAACVADAISRVEAVDDPSEFALHYSGLNEGPTEAFGIEAGAFDKLAANLPIYDPRLAHLRGRCLDYLRGISIKPDGSEANTIFNFDQCMTPLAGDLALIHQLSIQLALPRPNPRATFKSRCNNAAKLISGRNGSIIEMLPEFEYFRDIVFHFKHAVSGQSPTPANSDAVEWLPSHATLHWTTKQAPTTPQDEGQESLLYSVRAFHGNEQEFVEEFKKDEAVKKSSYFKSFVNFFGKTSAERNKLSSADPTNIINSCSEKVLKGK